MKAISREAVVHMEESYEGLTIQLSYEKWSWRYMILPEEFVINNHTKKLSSVNLVQRGMINWGSYSL